MRHSNNKSENISKTFYKLLIIAFAFLFLSSCHQGANYKESKPVSQVDITKDYQVVSEKSEVKIDKTKPLNLKIIRSANVKYKVKDVKLISKKINNLVNTQNGYISDMRFSNNLYRKDNRFTIKIPQVKFNFIMDSISKFAEFIDYENITSKDVTEEFVDLETRLKTKLEVKKRYETILRKRAKSIEDILATEEKLRIIQEEIEASQGRLKYLTNKVSLSTIEVNLYETVEYKDEPISYSQTFLSKIKNGFSFGWDLIENIIIGAIYIWPLIIIAIVGFIYFKRRRR